MTRRLIIEETSVYEVDEDCMRKKEAENHKKRECRKKRGETALQKKDIS